MSEKDTPIYAHKMGPAAWKLLWWLICKMDAEGQIKKDVLGWKTRASRDIGVTRWNTSRAADLLMSYGLIETIRRARSVKVVTARLKG